MNGFEAAVKMITIGVLFYCAGKDIKTRRIFIGWIIFLVLLGSFYQILAGDHFLYRILSGSLAGILLRLFGGLTQEAIGKGDGDLTAAIGIQLGFFRSLELLMYAFLLSALISMFLILLKKADRKKKIPFIPFLFIGYLGTVLAR